MEFLKPQQSLIKSLLKDNYELSVSIKLL